MFPKFKQLSTDNQLAQITIGVLDKLGSISRPLRIYLKRESVQDRRLVYWKPVKPLARWTNTWTTVLYPIVGEPNCKAA